MDQYRRASTLHTHVACGILFYADSVVFASMFTRKVFSLFFQKFFAKLNNMFSVRGGLERPVVSTPARGNSSSGILRGFVAQWSNIRGRNSSCVQNCAEHALYCPTAVSSVPSSFVLGCARLCGGISDKDRQDFSYIAAVSPLFRPPRCFEDTHFRRPNCSLYIPQSPA